MRKLPPKIAAKSCILMCAFSPFLFADQAPTKLSQSIQKLVSHESTAEDIAAFIYFIDKGENLSEKLTQAKSKLPAHVLQRRAANRGADKVVTLRDLPIDADYLSTVAGQVSKVRHALKKLNAVSVEASPDVLKKLANLPFVDKITRVKRAYRTPEPVSLIPDNFVSSLLNPAMSTPSIAMDFDYGSSLTQNAQINVPAVHNLGYDGSGVVIAVFDSGFNRLTHESFNQIDIAGTWDFVNNDADVGDGGMGVGSHGTNTLSTIGGYSPGQLIGPAFGATYYLAKTENTESELHVEEDNWCAAAEWAEQNGAHIISSSLGYNDFDSGGDYAPSDMDGDTAIVTVCADIAAQDGIVVVNSAGNSGNSSQNTLGAPSDGHFVLAVGAVTSSGARSSFSSVGLSADGRIKPDVMAMGSSVRVASQSSNTGYRNVNGTSFSCPLTAGVAALMLEANPNLTAIQVRDILRNTADNADSPNRLMGYGIIDALAAVEAATSLELTANFTHSTDLLSVTFTDSTNTPADSITSWAWDFGDGATSFVQNPTYTYASAGTYTVTLTVADSDGSQDTQTTQISVTDEQPPVSYCTAQGNSTRYEWMAGLRVGAFTNTSGAQGYSDFTDQVVELSPGETVNAVFTPGFSGSSYNEFWQLWIDLNGDGDFEDAGEAIASGNGSSEITDSFTVPAAVGVSETRMRVAMRYNSAPSSCGSFDYGEVEDYTIRFAN